MTLTIPTTYLSLHDVTSLRAATLTSTDTPLLLTVDGEYGSMQISLYLRVGASRTARIADAINAILKEPDPPKITCPVETAAYKSADDYWASLKRDLDARPIGSTDPETARKVAAAHYLVTGSIK
jgi:hypothetical protein